VHNVVGSARRAARRNAGNGGAERHVRERTTRTAKNQAERTRRRKPEINRGLFTHSNTRRGRANRHNRTSARTCQVFLAKWMHLGCTDAAAAQRSHGRSRLHVQALDDTVDGWFDRIGDRRSIPCSTALLGGGPCSGSRSEPCERPGEVTLRSRRPSRRFDGSGVGADQRSDQAVLPARPTRGRLPASRATALRDAPPDLQLVPVRQRRRRLPQRCC
jgi:hypothetical protein